MVGGTVGVSTEFGSMLESPCVSVGLLAGFGDIVFTAGAWRLDQRIRVAGTSGGVPFNESVDRDIEMSWLGVEWSHPWLAADLIETPGARWRLDLRSGLGAAVVSGSADAVATPNAPRAGMEVEETEGMATLSGAVKSELRLGGGWSISTSARYTTGILGDDQLELSKLLFIEGAVELRW